VHTLNAAALFAAWESGLPQGPVQRALTLLAIAWPERSIDDWAHAIIGERDEHLLRIRDEVFGPTIEAIIACAACGERLDISFTSQSIRVEPAQLPDRNRRFSMAAAGYEVSFRLPNSADLITALESGQNNGSEILLKRCVEASRKDKPIDPLRLPPFVLKLLNERMAAADPQAQVLVDLLCPACEHRRSVVFDILSYLWSEIDDWARRLLTEVHALASAYGWSEAEILSLSARRRQLYLQMIEG
jgi:hypothetical protein